jgi:flagellar basal-body rod protein FlgF
VDSTGYTTLGRQSGLMREMQVVANNIANISTAGFRREGVIFTEHVSRLDAAPSLSMARASARHVDLGQAGLTRTGGTWDFAIQGSGFFLIQTPQGDQLSRAGSFTPNEAGELVTADGHRLLDEGGSPVFVPPDARAVGLARDGTLSADGVPLARIGLWAPRDPQGLQHEAGTRFSATGGVEPVEGATVLQGFLEESNVNPIAEIARMVEVQRAYEMGQRLLDRDDERVRLVITTLGR